MTSSSSSAIRCQTRLRESRARPAIRPASVRWRKTLLLFLPLCSLVAVVLSGNPADVFAARVQKNQPVVQPRDLAQRIHRLINAQRRQHGLTVLAWDARLAQVAEGHSRDMSRRSYLGHDSPEGRTFADRYRQAGYTCAIRIGLTEYTGAENIALLRLYNSMTTENSVKHYDWNTTPQLGERAVTGWMHSPGHRDNILTPHWRHEGIGVVIGPGNAVYVTQNFC